MGCRPLRNAARPAPDHRGVRAHIVEECCRRGDRLWVTGIDPLAGRRKVCERTFVEGALCRGIKLAYGFDGLTKELNACWSRGGWCPDIQQPPLQCGLPFAEHL